MTVLRERVLSDNRVFFVYTDTPHGENYVSDIVYSYIDSVIKGGGGLQVVEINLRLKRAKLYYPSWQISVPFELIEGGK